MQERLKKDNGFWFFIVTISVKLWNWNSIKYFSVVLLIVTEKVLLCYENYIG